MLLVDWHALMKFQSAEGPDQAGITSLLHLNCPLRKDDLVNKGPKGGISSMLLLGVGYK